MKDFWKFHSIFRKLVDGLWKTYDNFLYLIWQKYIYQFSKNRLKFSKSKSNFFSKFKLKSAKVLKINRKNLSIFFKITRKIRQKFSKSSEKIGQNVSKSSEKIRQTFSKLGQKKLGPNFPYFFIFKIYFFIFSIYIAFKSAPPLQFLFSVKKRYIKFKYFVAILLEKIASFGI